MRPKNVGKKKKKKGGRGIRFISTPLFFFYNQGICQFDLFKVFFFRNYSFFCLYRDKNKTINPVANRYTEFRKKVFISSFQKKKKKTIIPIFHTLKISLFHLGGKNCWTAYIVELHPSCSNVFRPLFCLRTSRPVLLFFF